MRSAFAVFLRGFVLPFGATSGRRIVLDGVSGEIVVYNLVGNPVVIIGRATKFLRLPSADSQETSEAGWRFQTLGVGAARRVQLVEEGAGIDSGVLPTFTLQSESPDATQPAGFGFDTSPGSPGPKMVLASGSNRPQGEAVLVAGTVTVSNSLATTTSRVFLSRRIIGGTPGNLSYTRAAGSFTINSDNALDTSTVDWLLLDVIF